MEWILLFAGFIIGYLLRCLISGTESEAESYWRNQYFILKDSLRKDVIWRLKLNICTMVAY